MSVLDISHSLRRKRLKIGIETNAKLFELYMNEGVYEDNEGNSILERLWAIIDELEDMDRKIESVRE